MRSISNNHLNFFRLFVVCTTLVVQIRSYAVDEVVNIAGTTVSGYAGDGGPASAAQFNAPLSLVLDPSGNLLISDIGNNAIRRIDKTTGIITTVVGTGVRGFSGDGGPANQAQLNAPVSMVYDSAGNLLFTDQDNHRIRKVTPDGVISTIAGTGSAATFGDGGPAVNAALNTPAGLALDSAGNLYVSEINGEVIRKIDTSGMISTVAGTGGAGFSGDGGPATAATLHYPGTLAVVTTNGNLIVCDTANQRVRQIDTNGKITTLAGNGVAAYSGDGGNAQAASLFIENNGGVDGSVCFDAAGNAYISDSYNNVIRKVDLNGIITTIAGTGSAGYNGNFQPASLCALSHPEGLVTESNGNILFCDFQNNLIRELVFGANVPTGFNVNSIFPNHGGNAAAVTATINGSGFIPTTGFQPGASVKLVRTGFPDIPGQFVQIDSLEIALTATFDLTGATPGVYDVVVTNADGGTRTLSQAFTIEATTGAQLSINLLGRSQIRGGLNQVYSVAFQNSGNEDAYCVPILITFPNFCTFSQQTPITDPPPTPGTPVIDSTKFPALVQGQTTSYVAVVIPEIDAGSFGVFEFQLKVPDVSVLAHVHFKITASIGAPLLNSATALQSLQNRGIRKVRSGPSNDCIDAAISTFFDCAGLVPGVGCPAGIALNVESALTETFQAQRDGKNVKATAFNAVLGAAINSVEGCVPILNIISNIQGAFNCGYDLGQLPSNCMRPPQNKAVESIVSGDPNEKSGPVGFGPANAISPGTPMTYEIDFENLATATAPAQTVVVTDTLDANTLDLNTFSLGPITFGTTVVTPPNGLSSFSTQVDLRPGNNLLVKLNVSLDKNTGNLTCTFTSIDPATGQPTTDPAAGFLPPNKTGPEGDGSIVYMVQQKRGLPNGTVINNNATIVFDANSPITTNTWSNTIDTAAPVSAVSPLAAKQATQTFPVSWGGADAGAGIATYTISVSTNGGAPVVWQSSTANSSAMFTGQRGATYAFYCVATDQLGNVEAAHASPDTTTQVAADADASAMSVVNVSGSLKFTSMGHDMLSVVGIVPDIPAGFSPKGVVVAVNVGGAGTSFTLDSSGKAKAGKGTFMLKLRTKKDPKTKLVSVQAGMTAFQAKFQGAFAATLALAGFAQPQGRAKLATTVNTPVDLFLGATVYSQMTAIKYSATAKTAALRFKE